jgi:hypothetical protein
MVDRRRLNLFRPGGRGQQQQGEAIGASRNRHTNAPVPREKGVEFGGEALNKGPFGNHPEQH